MTAAELRDVLKAVPISQRQAAKRLGVHDRMMRRYCSGARPIPCTTAIAIELHFGKRTTP